MAVQEFFSGFDEAPDEYSRSAHKRDAQALRKTIEKIANLGDQSFKSLELPEDVKDAIIVARSLRAKSDERRRQLQYAAKLARFYDDEIDFEQRVNSIGASAKEDPNAMRLEKLRTVLIEGGVDKLNAFCSLILDMDRNKLRTLVKKAKEEAQTVDEAAEKPNQRALFKFIKKELARAKIEIPNELLTK